MKRPVRVLIKCVSAASVAAMAAGAGAQDRQSFEPEMVHIPGGAFVMGGKGCDDPDYVNKGECPRHRVRISAFEISKYEITWDQWDACVRDNGCDADGVRKAGGDEGWGRGNRPVINVSWNDAQDYVAWLRRKTGKAYRLLSEAEWEYAARAGSTARYSWGDQNPVCDESARNGANFSACPDDRSRPVGSFRPNAFGLHDMHGNVSEWAEDCWNNSYENAPADGSAWRTGDCRLRVLRGGSWPHGPWYQRPAFRGRIGASHRIKSTLGFRIARTL